MVPARRPSRLRLAALTLAALTLGLLTPADLRAQEERAEASAARPADEGWAHAVVSLMSLGVPDSDILGSFTPAERWPHVRLDGEGEAWVGFAPVVELPRGEVTVPCLAVRVRPGASARVVLGMPSRGEEPVEPFVVELEPGEFVDDAAEYHSVAASRAQMLLAGDLPGAGWFRHAMREHGPDLDPRARNAVRRPLQPTVEDSFQLFSGGRAVSENLQLDRSLPVGTGDAETTLPVSEVPGVLVEPYDWGDELAPDPPPVDPLARHLPADQHAVFFPSFGALLDVADHAEDHGLPVVAAVEPRSQTASTRRRYEQQLGLPLSALARLVGPAVIRGVALTGSDVALRMGSDVALVFEGDGDTLLTLLSARVGLAAGEAAARGVELETTEGDLDGLAYRAIRSADRRFCSYVARLADDAVVVTNSPAQLARLAAVAKGEAPALVDEADYRFFRQRYRRGDADESALVILTDATIRRWCGPRWRIGASRRTRAAAVLAELHARHAAALVAGAGADLVLPRGEEGDDLPDIGPLRGDAHEIRSEHYGSLAFATPVAELDLDRVSEEEALLYGRWRDGYARNWTRWFDPIALRVTVDAERLAADVTVRPLILGTEYDDLRDFAGGASILDEEGAPRGDPHAESLLHVVVAFDRDAPAVRGNEFLGLAGVFAPQLDPLGWVGEAVGFYVDRDPFWEEMAAAEDLDRFLEEHFLEMPVGFHVDVSDGLRLTAFLVGVRAMTEQSAPGMVRWINREHAGFTYVRVEPTEETRRDLPFAPEEDPALHYAASGDGLVLSLSEAVVRRHLERRTARQAAEGGDQAHDETDGNAEGGAGTTEVDGSRPVTTPWLGRQAALSVDRQILDLVEAGLMGSRQQPLRTLAWRNLPILDEWKRLFPDEDPLAVHERLYGRRLLCPGGGGYRWSEADGRMESTLYGHPGRPRSGPVLPPQADAFGSARFGLEFERDGLRAQVELTRQGGD